MTGIGFIGGGAILKQNDRVSGVATLFFFTPLTGRGVEDVRAADETNA